MENDQLIAAGANLEANSKLRSRPSQRGYDTVMAAAGGVEISKRPEQERAPLLAGDDEGQNGRSESDVDDPQGDDFKWQGEEDFKERPWWNKPSVFWMLPAFLVATTAFGSVVVPRLDLITTLICQQYFSDQAAKDPSLQFMPVLLGHDNPQCKVPEVSSMVSTFTLFTNLIAGLLSAVTSPKLGSLSDRYGRRRLIACCSIGMLIGEAITVLTAEYPNMFPVQWLYVGSFFDGLCGSFTASMALTFAYASDCTSPASRNVVFGWFHGCLFTGIALGPVLGGYTVKASGNVVTIFYIVLACHCAYALFMLFVIPESLTTERQMAARDKQRYAKEGQVSTRRSNILAPLAILYPTGEGSTSALRRNLVLLAGVDTAMFGVVMGSQTVVLIYAKSMFGWDTLQQSIFLSTVSITRVSVLLLALPAISRIFRGPKSTAIQQHSGSDNLDLSIIRVAIVFDLLGYIGYSTVMTGPLFFLSGIISSFGGMGPPTLGAALTKHVPQDRTGQVLGAVGLLHALARVVGPTVFNLIFSLTVGTVPQTVFFCLTGTFGVGFFFSWFVRPHVHWDEHSRSAPSERDHEGAVGGSED